MHTLIYALVEASTEANALAAARPVFDRLAGRGPYAHTVFDTYVMFDDGPRSDAAFDRWGDFPAAAPVESVVGQGLIERGWRETETEFERNLDRVREILDRHTDEEIMRDEDLSRHAFYRVGAYRGPTVALYDEHANGIRDRDRLDERLATGDNLWVVPADVHF
jgi:hypothetical protein